MLMEDNNTRKKKNILKASAIINLLALVICVSFLIIKAYNTLILVMCIGLFANIIRLINLILNIDPHKKKTILMIYALINLSGLIACIVSLTMNVHNILTLLMCTSFLINLICLITIKKK